VEIARDIQFYPPPPLLTGTLGACFQHYYFSIFPGGWATTRFNCLALSLLFQYLEVV